ncbi:transcriptional regulator [Bacillus sp. AFS002410]|uniref:two-component system regulatory protein YycI n=1 Tax=Bacillus sp. AFS002410 TaxID=2033481 RepID=UPI000BEF8900|nr:two-component system regulatory protein YycI [Bacillus sp. AFS002410]PEJ58663.1 transcriptional regulator [Bacillus sp. AFS002410]
MDWSRIKTIFILTFLVLDIFLAIQFYQKRSSDQFDTMAESSIEEQLKENDITYVTLPKNTLKESYISGNSKDFSKKVMADRKGQDIQIYKDVLQSELKKPVPIAENNRTLFLENFVKEYVWNGNSYHYCQTDQNTKTIYFCQTYKDRLIYNISSSVVILNYNDKNEIYGYKQKFLENLKEMVDKKNVQEALPAIKAIENLYVKDELKPSDRITKIDFGYYTVIPLSTGVKFIAPAWHIVVNEHQDYFVNAIEGQIIKMDKKQWSEY